MFDDLLLRSTLASITVLFLILALFLVLLLAPVVAEYIRLGSFHALVQWGLGLNLVQH